MVEGQRIYGSARKYVSTTAVRSSEACIRRCRAPQFPGVRTVPLYVNVLPAAGGGKKRVYRETVWEKVLVCLPRDGNETGRWEATWLTGRDGTTRFLGGTGRDGIGKRVGNILGKSVGNILGKSVENTVGKRCPEWLGTRRGTGAGENV